MSKRDWIKPEDIQAVVPENLVELWERKADIETILGEDLPLDFWDWAPNYYSAFWLFYVGNEPVGYIRRDVFMHHVTIELHGRIRPEWRKRGIEHYATLAVLNHTFFVFPRDRDLKTGGEKLGWPLVIIGVEDGNKGALGFARRWGFVRSGEKEGNTQYYCLTRDKFLRGDHYGSSKGTEGEGGKG